MTKRDSQTRLVAREGGSSWVAQILGLGLRYVAMLFATHALGTKLFGDYTLALAVTGIVTVVAVLGFAPGAMPFLSRARKQGDEGEVRAVIRSAVLPVSSVAIVLSLLLYFAAPWLAVHLFHKPGLTAFLQPLSALVAIGASSTVLLVILQGFMAVKERAWIERVLATGVTAGCMAIAWWFELGIEGAVAATLLGGLAALVVGFRLVVKKAPGALNPAVEAGPSRIREMISYSWPLMGTSMLAFLLMWTDVLMMGRLSNSEDVGIYGACARIAPAVLLVHDSLGPVFVARLSDLYVVRNWDEIKHLYQLTARWAMWPGLVIAWILALWGAPVLTLFSPEFAAGASILAMLSLGRLATVSSGMSGRVLSITGRARLNMFNMLLLVGGNMALNLFLIPIYGGMGAAIATTISLIAVKTLQVIELRVLYSLLPWDRTAWMPVIGISALGGLAYPLREGLGGPLGWLVPLIVFCLACGVLFITAGLRDEDREVWRALRERAGK